MVAIMPIYIAPHSIPQYHSDPHRPSGKSVYMMIDDELINLSCFDKFYIMKHWTSDTYAIYGDRPRQFSRLILDGYETKSEALEELKRLQEYLEK